MPPVNRIEPTKMDIVFGSGIQGGMIFCINSSLTMCSVPSAMNMKLNKSRKIRSVVSLDIQFEVVVLGASECR